LSICKKFPSLPLGLAAASITEATDRLGLRYRLCIHEDPVIDRDAKGQARQNLWR
jgi:hypothetical protein